MKTAFSRSLYLALLVILFQMITVVTAAPPQLVKDINATLNATGSDPQNFCAVGSVVFFTATDITHGTELWKSDGTLSGTVLLKNIGPGDSSSEPANLTVVDNKLYFTANDGIVGFRLWMSDGTSAGTFPVNGIVDASNLTVVGNTLYFMRNQGSTGNELWKIDDMVTGPVLVKTLGQGGQEFAAIEATSAGGTLFFMTRASPLHGQPQANLYRLWKSNGTESGTVPLKDFVNDGYELQVPLPEPPTRLFYLTAVGDALFFAACDETSGWELWRSDGTEGGTVPVKDILEGTESSHPVSLTAVGSNLYFTADSESDAELKELWKSDGTKVGTVKVMDIENGISITNPTLLTALNNTLYFGATSGSYNHALWKSNDIGTFVVKDIEPSALAAVGSTLYAAVSGNQLWKSDGTTSGTLLAKEFDSGMINPLMFKAVGNALYFQADDSLHGYEPWKTVDSVVGAFMVKDIYGGSNSSSPSIIVAVDSVSFFVADDGIHGRELWKSDGTVSGTFMVKDINPGGMGAQPSDLIAIGDILYFKAYDPSTGYELWRSDGTDSGTFMVRDILFGSEGSDPSALTVMNNNLGS